MKILVRPNHMEMGGAQLNAIELAEGVQRRGHEVALYAPAGDLLPEAEKRGLEVIPAYRLADRPIPRLRSVAHLDALLAKRSFDVIHAYECDATLDTLYGPGWTFDVPVLSTVMSMAVPFYLPTSVPLIVGTRELYASESQRRPEVYLMEPPIDTELNAPGAVPQLSDGAGSAEVRSRWGVEENAALLVIVGRLAHDLKLDGLLEAVRAMPLLPPGLPAHLLIVGDGPERPVVEAAAAQVNAGRDRPMVTLTGQLMDPRPVYQAADIVIGMGGSALRGMAFGKPLIVQGVQGFWKTMDAASVDLFLHQGWFGVGAGTDGAPVLARLITDLLRSADARRANGELGRRLVQQHYSLDHAVSDLEGIYESLARRHTAAWRRLGRAGQTGYTLAKLETALTVRRVRDRVAQR